MNQTIPCLLCFLCAQDVPADATQTTGAVDPKPNVIVILGDDLGYGGPSCFDAREFEVDDNAKNRDLFPPFGGSRKPNPELNDLPRK